MKAMKHTKTVHRASRCTRLAPRAVLVMLALISILATDTAMARKAKGGLSPGNQPAANAQTAAQSPPGVPETIKPIPSPRRHGAKGRGISR